MIIRAQWAHAQSTQNRQNALFSHLPFIADDVMARGVLHPSLRGQHDKFCYNRRAPAWWACEYRGCEFCSHQYINWKLPMELWPIWYICFRNSSNHHRNCYFIISSIIVRNFRRWLCCRDMLTRQWHSEHKCQTSLWYWDPAQHCTWNETVREQKRQKSQLL